MNVRHAKKVAIILGVLPLVAALGGCSMDDVQFNGGLFNAVGLGGDKVKSAEPKMAARAPLVIPPTLDRVPEPGTPPEAAATDVAAALDDPDKKAVVTKADLERQQAEYCKKNYELAKAHGDETAADLAAGPLGPCRGSVLTAIKKWNSSEE
jgi:hypothetical protein